MGNPAKEEGGVRVRAHSFKAVRVVRVRAVSGDSGMRRWGKSEEVSVRWKAGMITRSGCRRKTDFRYKFAI